VYTIENNIANNALLYGIRPTSDDKVSVSLSIKLRPTNVEGMFGDHIVDNPEIDLYTNILIAKVPKMHAIAKIKEFVIDILTNNKPDNVNFIVSAEGSDVRAEKGQIKGDIRLRVEAKTKTEIPSDIKEPISFSLKTGSMTSASNLGIFGGIFKLCKLYNLEFIDGMSDIDRMPENYKGLQDLIYRLPEKWQDEDHFISYVRDYLHIQDSFLSKKDDSFEGGTKERKMVQTSAELEHLKKTLVRFMKAFTDEVKGKDSDSYNADPHDRLFASRTFEFLRKELFGTDMADYIHITAGDVKEIRSSDIDELKHKYVIKVESEGNGIINFYGINMDNEKKLLFRIRPRLEYSLKSSKKTQTLQVEIADLT